MVLTSKVLIVALKDKSNGKNKGKDKNILGRFLTQIFFFFCFQMTQHFVHSFANGKYIEKTKYFIFILISPLFFSGLMLYDVI